MIFIVDGVGVGSGPPLSGLTVAGVGYGVSVFVVNAVDLTVVVMALIVPLMNGRNDLALEASENFENVDFNHVVEALTSIAGNTCGGLSPEGGPCTLEEGHSCADLGVAVGEHHVPLSNNRNRHLESCFFVFGIEATDSAEL